jgi:hypothetical protein
MSPVTRGLIAGAVGTTALNIATYLDIVVRGRPASSTPERSVQRLAEIVGLDLGKGGEAENRTTGLAAVLSYAIGLGGGVAYAFLVRRRLPWPAAAAVFTGLTMAGPSIPMTLLGVTDPRHWSPADWTADLLFHVSYGAAAAAAYERVR